MSPMPFVLSFLSSSKNSLEILKKYCPRSLFLFHLIASLVFTSSSPRLPQTVQITC
jgi:hypothetical protein